MSQSPSRGLDNLAHPAPDMKTGLERMKEWLRQTNDPMALRSSNLSMPCLTLLDVTITYAERYQWLRDISATYPKEGPIVILTDECGELLRRLEFDELDVAIDKARMK